MGRAVGTLVRRRMSRGGGRSLAWSERLRGGRPGDRNAWETFQAGHLPRVVARLRGVASRRAPAVDVIREFGGPDTIDIPCRPTMFPGGGAPR